MNITTFNQGLDLPELETVPPRLILPSYLDHQRPPGILNSPLFYYEILPGKRIPMEEFHSYVQYVVHEENSMPFNSFRLWLQQSRNPVSVERPHVKILVWRSGEGFAFQASTHPEAAHPIVYMGRASAEGICIAARQRGVWLGLADVLPEAREGLEDSVQELSFSIVNFLYEVNSPATFKASVEPRNKGGKSAEWVKSRTHYVVLQRTHPANSKEVASGSNVAVSDRDIKRMAHTRRAHTRILRSDRWGKNKGRMIRVKACWVGPKEWEQSNSIYRIVH